MVSKRQSFKRKKDEKWWCLMKMTAAMFLVPQIAKFNYNLRCVSSLFVIISVISYSTLLDVHGVARRHHHHPR